MGKRTLYLMGCLLILVLCGQSHSKAAEDNSLQIKTGDRPSAKVSVWLENSLKRVFLSSKAGSTNLSLLTARNAKASFQVCLRNNDSDAALISCGIVDGEKFSPRVRFVGMVPLPHFTRVTDASELDGLTESGATPGLVPDPLYPQTNAVCGSFESRSFWISLFVPADITPGIHEFKVQLNITNRSNLKKGYTATLPVKVEVSSLVIQPRVNFPVTHWWRGEATWDYYKTGMFDDRWYQITRLQLENMLEHGSDVIYVPIFMNRHETFRRPCQLLIVNEPSPGKYEFDWSEVKKFTDMCKDIGFKSFEWSHLWIYGGVKHPMSIYKKVDGQYVMLWKPDISGFSDTYLNFMRQFLPEFKRFLDKEGLLNASYFHLSDEPIGTEALNNYKRARQFLREQAPWMKVMDAMYSAEFARDSGTDMPIPQLGHAKGYRDVKMPHWVYFCCSPKGPWLNRFLDTPLPKVRMAGWLFFRLEPKGFLHWGFNYWHKMSREEIGDPFHDASNDDWPGIPFGDPFMIYPGADGTPIDCIRWEVFAESLQDYAILQAAGIKPDAAMLSEIKGYDVFPKNAEWIDAALRKILKADVR